MSMILFLFAGRCNLNLCFTDKMLYQTEGEINAND